MASEQSLASSKKAAGKNQLQSVEIDIKPEGAVSSPSSQSGSEVPEKMLLNLLENSQSPGPGASSGGKGSADLAKELTEFVSFVRENRIGIQEILQGAKIAETLRRYGSEPAQFARFLQSIYSRASEKGYTSTEILNQCEKINNLEQKYGTSFEKLKTKFDLVGKELLAKTKEAKTLEHDVSVLQTKRTKLMEQYSMDEKRLMDYSETREQLVSMNLDMKNFGSLRNCLVALKEEHFDPKAILEKVETIGLLEPRKKALQTEISKQKEQLDQNQASLNQIKRVRETGLTLDQIERIRQVVAQISANRGIVPDQAFSTFEQDVLKNYDSSLGLIPEIARLQENKQKTLSEIERKHSELDEREKEHLDKIKKLEERFSARKAEIDAFNDLRSMGIDGAEVLKWEKLISECKLDSSEIESELKKYKNLKQLEEQEERKVRELRDAEESLGKSIANLISDKKNLEESMKLLKDSALTEFEAARAKILSSMSELNDKALSNLEQSATQIATQNEKVLQDVTRASQQGIKEATEETKNNLVKALSEASSTVSGFSDELKQALKGAEAEIKVVSQTLDAGERIGKYKAILPLLEIMSDESTKVAEAEALIAMWNVSSRFNMWLSSRYGDQKKKEIADPLASLIKAMNNEIQRVDE